MTKKTPLFNKHIELKAKMTEFGGWEMPVQYQTTIIEEHLNVREKLGLFDVSHMGEFFVQGEDSLKFLQTLVPQNIAKLVDGKAVYCQLLNKNGGIIDDLIIYRLKENYYLLLVNASRIDVDFNWVKENSNGYNITLENKSDEFSLLALQGPLSPDLIEKLGLKKDEQPQFFSTKKVVLCGKEIYISRTGYTGEDGFELLMKNCDAEFFWDKLLNEGKEFGIKPIGLGARDTLRLEVALPLYGNDLNETLTPLDTGLGWSVAKKKEEEYNGKAKILSQLETKPDYKMIGFEMLERAIPRHEYEIFYNDEKIGYVSSGGVSPSTSKYIGLGIIKNDGKISIDTEIDILIRNKKCKAKVVKRPFVEKKNMVKK